MSSSTASSDAEEEKSESSTSSSAASMVESENDNGTNDNRNKDETIEFGNGDVAIEDNPDNDDDNDNSTVNDDDNNEGRPNNESDPEQDGSDIEEEEEQQHDDDEETASEQDDDDDSNNEEVWDEDDNANDGGTTTTLGIPTKTSVVGTTNVKQLPPPPPRKGLFIKTTKRTLPLAVPTTTTMTINPTRNSISSGTGLSAPATAAPARGKMRIRLSLKLPTTTFGTAAKIAKPSGTTLIHKKKRKLPTAMRPSAVATLAETSDDDEETEIAEAVVQVDSDDDEEASNGETYTAAAPRETRRDSLLQPHHHHFKKPLPIVSKATTGSASKRRSFMPCKQTRLPPLTSPGLLLIRSPAAGYKQPQQQPQQQLTMPSSLSASTGTVTTPQHVFDSVMTAAGYTYEQRSTHPHRGSSVQRTIDDMFDTNVKLSFNMPELVPKEFWNCKMKSDGTNEEEQQLTMPQMILRALEQTKANRRDEADPIQAAKESTRKRRRFPTHRMQDMLPVSLSIPYPEDYIQKRLDYLEKVKQREKAIVQWQDAQEELEFGKASYEQIQIKNEDSRSAHGNEISIPTFDNHVAIPPIPEPPDPPRLQDLIDPSDVDESGSAASAYYYLKNDCYSAASHHPLYVPKGKDFVAHLDENCFHITVGRYFGLQTNCIADPNFVGPNAPGFAAINAAGSVGGLATATTSTTTSTSGLTGGGMTMILSASFHSAATVPSNKEEHAIAAKGKSIETGNKVGEETPTDRPEVADATGDIVEPLPSDVLSAQTGSLHIVKACDSEMDLAVSSASGFTADLKTIMEDESGVALAETFKDWIIRAAVHAGRTHRKESSFRGPNGEIYPDLNKAFTLYCGIKPCERCKNNKQGVRWHSCRVHIFIAG